MRLWENLVGLLRRAVTITTPRGPAGSSLSTTSSRVAWVVRILQETAWSEAVSMGSNSPRVSRRTTTMNTRVSRSIRRLLVLRRCISRTSAVCLSFRTLLRPQLGVLR